MRNSRGSEGELQALTFQVNSTHVNYCNAEMLQSVQKAWEKL